MCRKMCSGTVVPQSILVGRGMEMERQHTLLEKIWCRHDWSLPTVILEFKFILVCCKNMGEQDTLLPSQNFYLQFVDQFYFKKNHWALPET